MQAAQRQAADENAALAAKAHAAQAGKGLVAGAGSRRCAERPGGAGC